MSEDYWIENDTLHCDDLYDSILPMKTLKKGSPATATPSASTRGTTTPGSAWGTSTTGRRSTAWRSITLGGRTASTSALRCSAATWAWPCTS